MKLYYEIEIGRKYDHNGELIIDTDAVCYEVDDFDIVCRFMKDFHPVAKMAVISYWIGADEGQRARFLARIMQRHGEEIEDFFRQRALDGAFCPVERESGAVDKFTEGKKNGAHSAKMVVYYGV